MDKKFGKEQKRKEQMMKITYIAHSGFLVELERCLLLFDYYKGEIPPLSPEKPLYVFASHRHGDHFNPEIFRLADTHKRVWFLLSHDIKLSLSNRKRWKIDGLEEGQIITMKANAEYEIPGLGKVETLKSTDEGVAFLVTAWEHVIFHAGDLNWWLWKGEDKGWLENMTADFKRETERIAGRQIDAAFLTLDDRQEEYFYKGMDWYLRSCRIRYAFPMHYWQDASVIRRFEKLECRKDYDTVILDTSTEKEWELP